MAIIDEVRRINNLDNKKKQRQGLYSRNSTPTIKKESLSNRKANTAPNGQSPSGGNNSRQWFKKAPEGTYNPLRKMIANSAAGSGLSSGEAFNERGPVDDMNPPASIVDRGMKNGQKVTPAPSKKADDVLQNRIKNAWGDYDKSGRYEKVDEKHGFSNVRNTKTGDMTWTNMGADDLANNSIVNTYRPNAAGSNVSRSYTPSYAGNKPKRMELDTRNYKEYAKERDRAFDEAQRLRERASRTGNVERRFDLIRNARALEKRYMNSDSNVSRERIASMSAASSMNNAAGKRSNEMRTALLNDQAKQRQIALDREKQQMSQANKDRDFAYQAYNDERDFELDSAKFSNTEKNDLLERNEDMFYDMEDTGSGLQERVFNPKKQADFIKVANTLGTTDGTETVVYQTLNDAGVNVDHFVDVIKNSDNPKAVAAFEKQYPGFLDSLK